MRKTERILLYIIGITLSILLLVMVVMLNILAVYGLRFLIYDYATIVRYYSPIWMEVGRIILTSIVALLVDSVVLYSLLGIIPSKDDWKNPAFNDRKESRKEET